MQTPPQLSHFDQEGQAHMVDISAKKPSHRMAIAQGSILMNGSTFLLISEGTAKKGDVLGIARIAGIMAAKKTSDLIPLCHPLALSRVTIDFQLVSPDSGGSQPDGKFSITCQCQVETVGATGVEMEAMTGVQIALLTIYDMCKAVERGMEITGVRLLEKHGGKTGSYLAASS